MHVCLLAVRATHGSVRRGAPEVVMPSASTVPSQGSSASAVTRSLPPPPRSMGVNMRPGAAGQGRADSELIHWAFTENQQNMMEHRGFPMSLEYRSNSKFPWWRSIILGRCLFLIYMEYVPSTGKRS